MEYPVNLCGRVATCSRKVKRNEKKQRQVVRCSDLYQRFSTPTCFFIRNVVFLTETSINHHFTFYHNILSKKTTATPILLATPRYTTVKLNTIHLLERINAINLKLYRKTHGKRTIMLAFSRFEGHIKYRYMIILEEFGRKALNIGHVKEITVLPSLFSVILLGVML